MNQQKFAQMVREFPFITKILTTQGLSADRIGEIVVARGDRNLIEIEPSAWAHDAGEYGDHEGYRSFWFVTTGEVGKFKSSWYRSITPHGSRAEEDTTPIGSQLLSLNRDVQFIVEIHEEHWDWEDETPSIVIYKMGGFDWRSYARPEQVAHS